jgi:hypothetical protein
MRPDGFDRSSGTSKIPHTAGAVAVTGASLWIVQSLIGCPARARAGTAVVGTVNVDGALATTGVVAGTEFVGAAPRPGESDEPHAINNPTDDTTATAQLARTRCLPGLAPRHAGPQRPLCASLCYRRQGRTSPLGKPEDEGIECTSDAGTRKRERARLPDLAVLWRYAISAERALRLSAQIACE